MGLPRTDGTHIVCKALGDEVGTPITSPQNRLNRSHGTPTNFLAIKMYSRLWNRHPPHKTMAIKLFWMTPDGWSGGSRHPRSKFFNDLESAARWGKGPNQPPTSPKKCGKKNVFSDSGGGAGPHVVAKLRPMGWGEVPHHLPPPQKIRKPKRLHSF